MALGGPACLIDAQQLENADVFFALLNQLEAQELCFSIEQLKTEISRLKASTTPTQQTGCLQIMTIHKAKGLEFDAVILPSLERKNAIQQQRIVNVFSQTQSTRRQ